MTKKQKQDFIKRVVAKTELDNKGAEALVDVVFEVAEDTLLETGKVALGSLGELKTAERAARKGRNPQTGEEIDIAAKTVAKFKEHKQLKEKLNA